MIPGLKPTRTASDFAPIDPTVRALCIGLNRVWQWKTTRLKRRACVGCSQLHLSSSVNGVGKETEVVARRGHGPVGRFGTCRRTCQSYFPALTWDQRAPLSQAILGCCRFGGGTVWLEFFGHHCRFAAHVCSRGLVYFGRVSTSTGPAWIIRTIKRQGEKWCKRGERSNTVLCGGHRDGSAICASSRWKANRWRCGHGVFDIADHLTMTYCDVRGSPKGVGEQEHPASI